MSLTLLPASHINDNFNRLKMQIPYNSGKIRLIWVGIDGVNYV